MGSTGLTKSQFNYSVNELEMLSIQWALDKLKVYTVGEQKVVVLTDNSSLIGTWNKTLDETENPRMVRLMEKMAHINLEIKHTKGSENKAADFLSRYQVEDTIPDADEVERNFVFQRTVCRIQTRGEALSVPQDIKMIMEAARDSEEYQTIIKFVRGEDVDEADTAIADIKNNKELSIDEKYGEALIYRNNQLMPPKEIRKELIKLAHVVHQSDDAMWRTVKQV